VNILPGMISHYWWNGASGSQSRGSKVARNWRLSSATSATKSAHRFISRRRSNSVAFGAKRTFSEPRLQNRIYDYAPFRKKKNPDSPWPLL
jgi:hypothetical protein